MLNTLISTKILDSISSIKSWKVLIIDPDSLHVLDSSCKMSEILSRNVTSVENIFNKRAGGQTTTAVYFLSATLTSVRAFIADYEGRPKYQDCHLFCLSALSDSLFDLIKGSAAKRFMLTLVELNIDFTAPSPNYFSLDIPETFFSIFTNSTEKSLIEYELMTMAKKICNVLVNLGEYPHIRYHSKPQIFQTSPTKSLSWQLAKLVEEELDNVCRVDKDFPPVTPYDRATLVITDRTLDVISCLIHDVHYEALLADIGGLHKQKFKDVELKKEYLLDKTDSIWESVRTQHIGAVTEFVQFKLEKFKTENSAAQYELGERGDGGESSIERLKDVMYSFGDYQTTKEFLGRHVNICLAITKIYAQRKLETVIEIEHEMCTTQAISSKLFKEFELALVDQNIEYFDKIRLLFLFVVSSEGVSDNERQKLLTLAKVDMADIQALTNLAILNVRLSPTQQQSRNDRNPYALSEVAKRNREVVKEYENDKYAPLISFLGKDALDGRLDVNWFPWVKEPPSSGAKVMASPASSSNSGFMGFMAKKEPAPQALPPQRKKPSWATRKQVDDAITSQPSSGSSPAPLLIKKNTRAGGGRIIFFIIGGATFSELKAMSDLEQKYDRQFFLGSTHIWTPDAFVEALKDLGKRNIQGAKFNGYQRPPDPRMRVRNADIPARPRDRSVSGSSQNEMPPRPGSGRDNSNRGQGREPSGRDPRSSRNDGRNDGRNEVPQRSSNRRSPPNSPPSRSRRDNQVKSDSRQGSLPETMEQLDIQKKGDKRGWFGFGKS